MSNVAAWVGARQIVEVQEDEGEAKKILVSVVLL